jgi:hypothetical protein
MGQHERRYRNRLAKLKANDSICKANRDFYFEFFEKEEYKLKRGNALRKLDEACYKTLYHYLVKFSNVNDWFKNKPLKDITEKDFKKFYDDFEDGIIVTAYGKPFKDRKSYYSKVFRSKPFEMLGKNQIVRNVMEFHKNTNPEEVRFIHEEEVRKIIDVMVAVKHKVLIWLAFDIGENINALLLLKKSDFNRQADKDTGIAEYRVNLRKETLKRTRKARSEITNFKETIELLDIVLKDLKEHDKLFDFEYANSKKIINRAVGITKSKCLPNGQKVTWKDLRSSMACDLLRKGWSCDEVNARLGHRPSSQEIDKYVNFLALDRHKPKKKIYDNNLSRIQLELEKSREREKLHSLRVENMQKEIKAQKEQMQNMKEAIMEDLTKEILVKLNKSKASI